MLNTQSIETPIRTKRGQISQPLAIAHTPAHMRSLPSVVGTNRRRKCVRLVVWTACHSGGATSLLGSANHPDTGPAELLLCSLCTLLAGQSCRTAQRKEWPSPSTCWVRQRSPRVSPPLRACVCLEYHRTPTYIFSSTISNLFPTVNAPGIHEHELTITDDDGACKRWQAAGGEHTICQHLLVVSKRAVYQ
jgi:hypothetical protein